MIRKIACLLNLLVFGFFAKADELVTYPAPAGAMYTYHNDDYTVRVRKPGAEWQDLFEYKVKVDLDNPQEASMAYFDFSGTVEVAVRKNNGTFREVAVRPFAFNVKTRIEGKTVFFVLNNPRKLSIEFDGDKLHNLHLFANELESNQPDPKDPNVIYFGPGIHQPKDIPGDEFNIPSGKTVYVAGGAIVRAKLVIDRASDVKIIGRGIIDQAVRGVEIRHSKNVSVDGLIFLNPKHYTIYGGGSDNITIRNIKSFGANPWTDGIDLMSCKDVVIDDVFMRTSDDCIAIYGHRWDYYGDAKNYRITNSILWADVAHPINIGLHGNTEGKAENIENMHFRNIDILEQDEDDPNYQGCIAISAGDHNYIRDLTFEDIRIDDFEEGQLLNLRVVNNAKYNTGPGRGIENVLFKNISYNGVNMISSVIAGLEAECSIKNVRFENLKINGKLIKDAKAGNIKIGDFVSEVSFIP